MMHPKMKNLFELTDGYHFELRGMESDKALEELLATKEYQVTEERILDALFDYHYLNRYNLAKIVDRGDIKRHIDKMIRQGMIEEYVLVDKNGNREENSLIAYQLSNKADQYLHEKKDRGYRRNVPVTDEDILKTLSLNQYHIGMILENADKIQSQTINFVDTYRDMGTVRIPSLIVLKNRLSLIALPMARRDEDFTTQVRTLLKLAGYLREKEMEHKFPLIIWVASSNKAVVEGMEKVKRIKELKDIPISYILDYNTKTGNPIHQIMSADIKSSNKVELSRITL